MFGGQIGRNKAESLCEAIKKYVSQSSQKLTETLN
jgi:hypothetical protein